LSSIGLAEYVENFKMAGFDDLDFLQKYRLTSEDLKAIGITKRGHQMKLEKLYKIEDFIDGPVSSGTESAEESDNAINESEESGESEESEESEASDESSDEGDDTEYEHDESESE